MSTPNTRKDSSIEFQKRFVAMCGTSNPRTISEFLGISYQAARNYLDGRIPESKVLVRFAEKSPVSIHWLLTGEGEKYVERKSKTEAEMLASVLSEIADAVTLRKMFEFISEARINKSVTELRKPGREEGVRTLTLKPDSIRNQKQRVTETTPVSKKGP